MKRGRSTGKPTRAQQARHDAIRESGCVIAHARGLGVIPCELHHLTVGGRHGQKRLGQDDVVGINRWSHRGEPLIEYGWDAARCREELGPSYAREPAAFREIYPDEELVRMQDEILHGSKAA